MVRQILSKFKFSYNLEAASWICDKYAMTMQCLTKFCQNQDVFVSVTYLSPTDASTPNTFLSPPHVAFPLSPPQAKTKTLNCLLAQINLKIWRIGKNQFYLTLWGLFPFPTSSRGKNSEVLKIRRIGKNQCYLNCEAYMDSSPRPLVVVRGVLWGDGSIMSPPLLALLLLRYIQPYLPQSLHFQSVHWPLSNKLIERYLDWMWNVYSMFWHHLAF